MQARQRRSWTLEEDQQLLEAIRIEEPNGSSKPSNWSAISKHVPSRTNKDCRKRWLSMHDGGTSKTTKGSWSKDEDDRLRAAVEVHGQRWCKVAEMVPGRNSDQCSKRWKDTLDPAIDRSKWSLEEDDKLFQAVEELGRKWAKIVKHYFPGRTGLSAKNRYNCIVHRRPAVITKERSSSPSISLPLGYWVTGTSPSPSCVSSASSTSIYTSASASTCTSPISPSASASYFSPVSPSDPGSPLQLYSPEVAKFSSDVRRLEVIAPDLDLTNKGTWHAQIHGMPVISDVPWLFLPAQPQFGPTLEHRLHDLHPISGPPSVHAHPAHVFKLCGSPRCHSTAKIALVLREKQIAYDFETNVNNDQPYIDDNGLSVCGYQNACQYLTWRYSDRGPKLVPEPSDARTMGLFGQVLRTQLSSFEMLARNVLCETTLRRQQGFLSNEIFTGSAMQGLLDALNGYEETLSRQNYLAGNEITLVDLYHLPYGEMLSNSRINVMFTIGPNVSRWWTEISSRPAWLAIKNGIPLQG